MTVIKELTPYQNQNRIIHACVRVEYQNSGYIFGDYTKREIGGTIIKSPTQGIITSGYEVSTSNSVRQNLMYEQDPVKHYGSIGDYKLDGNSYLTRKNATVSNRFTGFVSDWFWNGETFFTNQEGTYWESDTLSVLIPLDKVYDSLQLSILFRNGYPRNIKVKPTLYSSESGYLEINDDNHDEYFTNDGTLIIKEGLTDFGDKVILEMQNWSEPNQRPVIANTYVGIVRSYENDDLIQFNYTNSTDLLSRETPASTLSVELVNHGEFDVLNEDSYVQYLNNQVKVVVYFSIDDDVASNWIPFTMFYLKEWSNNDDTTTLYCESGITKIENTYVSAFNETEYLACYDDANKLQLWLSKEYGLTYEENNETYDSEYRRLIDIDLGNATKPDIGYVYGQMERLDAKYLLQWLQRLALWWKHCILSATNHIGADRIVFKKIVTDTTELSEIYLLRKEDCEGNGARIIQTEKIKKAVIDSFGIIDVSREDSVTTTKEVEVINNPQIIDLDFGDEIYKKNSENCSITLKDENNNTIDPSYYEISQYPRTNLSIKLSNQDGKKITVSLTTKYYKSSVHSGGLGSYYDEYNLQDEGVELQYDRVTGGKQLNDGFKERIKDLLLCNKNFEADTFGDPNLEVGDTILIETDYGNKPAIITSIDMTYDGGLRSTLKGLMINDN